MEKIIAQGAEAILIQKDDKLIKRRISKGYRHVDLDKKLRVRRTRSEAKLLEKSGKVISIPKMMSSDEKKSEIIMQFINEKRLSDNLDDMPLNNALNVCEMIGESIAKLHNRDIIHGDLTTSNMILHDNKIYFIDFGLGFVSNKVEDKAVDLHLLKQAFESKHFEKWQEYCKATLESYKKESKEANNVLNRLEKVEKRGRYKRKKK